MAAGEIALALVDARRLSALEGVATRDLHTLAGCLDDADGADVAAAAATLAPAGAHASHLYFGSEFCEHLFPEPAALERAAACAAALQLTLVLATPIANDALLAKILAAAAALPAHAEILVNDWGVASALRAAAPQRRLIAGRQLAKMIKDPRIASPAWMKPYASSYGAAGYRRILAGLGIAHLELDVPPFATAETFALPELAVSVWAPYAYVAKGRLCKIGALRQPSAEKFAPGRPCHHECLGLLEVGTEPSASGIVSYARGNSLYYHHDAAMVRAVSAALAAGHVSRLVLSGT